MLGLSLNITQLFGRFTPYRILKPLNEFRDDSQKYSMDCVNSPIAYKDRLRYLHLPSLELRRLHVDLVWRTFGIVETPAENFSCPVRMLQLKVTSELNRTIHGGVIAV